MKYRYIIFFWTLVFKASATSSKIEAAYETLTTINLKIPVQVCYNVSTSGQNDSNSSSSSDSSNNNKNNNNDNVANKMESVQMLADLKDEVAKNADCLAEVKADIKSLDEVKDNIRLLDKSILQLQQQLRQQQVAQPSCTVNSSLTCTMSIVDGTQYPNKPWYGPVHVLTDSCDDKSSAHDPATIDWWVAPVGAILDKAFFEVDLGCEKCVSQVTVKNSGNGNAANSGTKEFLVSVATESDSDNWIPVLRGKLADVRGVPCDDQPGKMTFHFAAIQARYARFEVISFHGVTGVLQYFDMS